jgi:hypothetical protein
MNLKFLITLLAVVVAALFVPIIPSDVTGCDQDGICEDTSMYVSMYDKFLK